MTPGSKDDYDPAHLYEVSTGEEVREWLERAEEWITSGRADVTVWERDFVRDMRLKYDTAVLAGFEQPFTGKQLVFLKRIWSRMGRSAHKKLKGVAEA